MYVAGRNADDIGNQSGGWTITWQGFSGDTIPGTTILEGIRQVAPRARVTFSADASAPTAAPTSASSSSARRRTPRASATSAGPSGASARRSSCAEKSLSLQAQDKAVIDKVCAAIATCVVLVVSGRPQVVTDQLGQIDALVASWLPGTEGAGVADVLFGTPAVHRQAAGELAAHRGAGADQRRRRGLRPAVPLRLGPAH